MKVRAVYAGEDTSKSGIAVSGTLVINGKVVTISSQDTSEISESSGFKYSLTDPLTLGSIETLINWLNDKFTLNLDWASIKTQLEGLPKPVGPFFTGVIGAEFVLTHLSVDTKQMIFEIAITMTPTDPINLIGNKLQLVSLGVGTAYHGSQAAMEAAGVA